MLVLCLVRVPPLNHVPPSSPFTVRLAGQLPNKRETCIFLGWLGWLNGLVDGCLVFLIRPRVYVPTTPCSSNCEGRWSMRSISKRIRPIWLHVLILVPLYGSSSSRPPSVLLSCSRQPCADPCACFAKLVCPAWHGGGGGNEAHVAFGSLT